MCTVVKSRFIVEEFLSQGWVPEEEQQKGQSRANCQQRHNDEDLKIGHFKAYQV
jgi:hypothetical protein